MTQIRPKTLADLIEWAAEDGYDLEIGTGEDGGWEIVLSPGKNIPGGGYDGPDAYPSWEHGTLGGVLHLARSAQLRRRNDGLAFGAPGSSYLYE